MFKSIKKYIKHFIGLGGPLYLVLVKLEIVKKYAPGLKQDVIDVLVILATISSYIISSANPERKYEKAQMMRNEYLQSLANEVREVFKTLGYDFQFNVMEAKRWWGFPRLKPNANGNGQRSFFPKILACTWVAPEDHPFPKTKEFMLELSQGTSGHAFTKQEPKCLNIENFDYEQAKKEMNLNHDQFGYLEGLTLLVSVPIVLKNAEKRKSRVIGALTLVSKTKNAGILIDPSNPSAREKFIKDIQDIASAYEKLYF